MYLSLNSLLLNTRHLFIKEKRKPKLSLTHFQNKFWGYVVCLDDDDDDCSTVVPTKCKKLSASAARNFPITDLSASHNCSSTIVPTSLKNLQWFLLNARKYLLLLATLQELKRCFDGLHLCLFTRDQVSRNPMAMPSTSVEFMAMLKDIHREVQYTMELKLKLSNFCC
ncbi:hypothetical protein Hanom_Chr10g00873501 [Helianthus anomalus]